jgi:hypothetical protein
MFGKIFYRIMRNGMLNGQCQLRRFFGLPPQHCSNGKYKFHIRAELPPERDGEHQLHICAQFPSRGDS